jgi:hypothetical protein
MIAKNAGIELQKLSHENCDEIFGVVNVEKLATEVEESLDFREFCSTSFKLGFNKAMELNKDKLFTLEDIKKSINWSWRKTDREEHILIIDEHNFIQSLRQPTEIEVEMEMEAISEGLDEKAQPQHAMVPKLDEGGCLILKKKEV